MLSYVTTASGGAASPSVGGQRTPGNPPGARARARISDWPELIECSELGACSELSDCSEHSDCSELSGCSKLKEFCELINE